MSQLADAGDAERLHRLADQALYQAKQRGRNQTCRHEGHMAREAAP